MDEVEIAERQEDLTGTGGPNTSTLTWTGDPNTSKYLDPLEVHLFQRGSKYFNTILKYTDWGVQILQSIWTGGTIFGGSILFVTGQISLHNLIHIYHVSHALDTFPGCLPLHFLDHIREPLREAGSKVTDAVKKTEWVTAWEQC